MYTKRIQLTNYGPIERVCIECPFDGDKPMPIVLVGENGSGKSILMSHIVNGLLRAQQAAYPATPQVAPGKVYKFRSPSYIRSGCAFYFAQIDFENGVHFGELQLATQRKDYQDIPLGIVDSGAQELWNQLAPSDTSTISVPSHDNVHFRELFEQNCILYFPPNRFEEPAWLNAENLNAKATRMNLKHMEGHTERTVIDYSPLRDNENWLYDVAYDFSVFEPQIRHVNVPMEGPDKSKQNMSFPIFLGHSGRAKTIYDIALQIAKIITKNPAVRFGIGTRDHRVISLMENDRRRVPNIFQLSSGEVSLLNLFLSILRDFDLTRASFTKAQDVRGIVVVDEVDLHLHTRHQYEILPQLLHLFPGVQFMLTTHSPLFVLGLQNTLTSGGFGLYRLPDGHKIAPEDFSEFGEAYRAFRKTDAHAMEIKEAVRSAKKPLLLVDGATDVKYLIRAMTLLDYHGNLADMEIRQGGGEGNLKNAWKTLVAGDVLRQTVVLFHDCESSVSPCDRNNLHRRKMPLIEDHPIRRGIENLFGRKSLERAIAHKPAFVDIVAEHETTERGQRRTIPEQWKINDDEKSNLCDWFCKNGTAEDFRYFRRLFDELGRIPSLLAVVAVDVADGVSARGSQ